MSIAQQANILNNKFQIVSNNSKTPTEQIKSSFLSLKDASPLDYRRNFNKKKHKRNKNKFAYETNNLKIFKLKKPYDFL